MSRSSAQHPSLPSYRAIHSHPRTEKNTQAALEGRYEIYGGLDLVRTPVDWSMDPRSSLAWRARFQDLRWLDVLIRESRRNPPGPATNLFFDLLFDWIGTHPTPDAADDSMAWSDKVTGDRAGVLGYAYRHALALGELSQDNVMTLRNAAVAHAEWLADDDNYTSVSNHGLFQDAGLLLLAHYLRDDSRAVVWRTRAVKRLISTLRRHVGASGVHLEHSPGYHADMIKLLTKVQRECEVESSELREMCQKLTDTLGWFIFPNSKLTPLGDSNLDMPLSASDRTAAHKAVGFQHFRDAGYAVVRTNDSHLVVTGAYHSHVHKHADDLSFCLFERNTIVAGDAGTFGYDTANPHRQYALQEEAHNVLAVDSERNVYRRSRPYGGTPLQALIKSENWYVIACHNVGLQQLNVCHRRWFIYRPTAMLILVDAVQAAEERELTRTIHFGPDLSLDLGDGRLLLNKEGFGWVEDQSDTDVEVTLKRGQIEPVVQGWSYPNYEKRQAVDTVELKSHATTAVLVTVLSFSPTAIPRVRAEYRPDGWLEVKVANESIAIAPGAALVTVKVRESN